MLADNDAQATVPVKSLDRARRFYEDVLGLKPLPRGLPGVQSYRAGGATVLVYESAFAGTNRATALTWPLGLAFDRVVQALRGKGVAFERYDLPGAMMDGEVHVVADRRLAWFKDPDGNIIHINDYPPARPPGL
ncbi:MAG: glyoxalase [Caulobacter sp.]|nr:glyoxalase [Caulobacter sp.]